MIVTESWLKEDVVAVLKDYKWWGRQLIEHVNKRAVRGSGSVGIFVKEELLKFLDVVILDDTVEDVMWVEIMSRIWNEWEGLLLGICYVPPELSGRQGNVEIFEKIGSHTMEFRDWCRVILCVKAE